MFSYKLKFEIYADKFVIQPEAIQELCEELSKNPRTDQGICWHLYKASSNDSIFDTCGRFIADIVYEIFSDCCQTWPHYSGDSRYPIKIIPCWRTPKIEYIWTTDKWEGNPGKHRRSLLKHFSASITKPIVITRG